ncbi:hypothetical protein E3J61_03375 [Candidatus Dependentiae bacterium]|nr:MAG: hypothetical protein E3J61_03375 [Candidatus Dependentiae bacterium]
MNFKNIILSVALILGSCSDSVLVAQPANEQSELIKKAKDTLDEFKKTLKCVFRKKGCDEKKRKEIIVKGLKILAVVAVLTTGVIWKFKPLSPAAAGDAYRKEKDFLDVVMGGAGADKIHKEIEEWLVSMKESRHATEETGFIEQKNKAYIDNYKAATKAHEDGEYQKAYWLIKAASKAIINANKRYEKESSEKAGMQASRRGKQEE